MGAVKLQWEQKYYRSCYVPRASQLLTRDTWVIVRARGMRLYTYWSAAYKSHKLNEVLCIPHFFADWSSSEGLCFMLIPPSKLCSTILFPSSGASLHPRLPATHPSQPYCSLQAGLCFASFPASCRTSIPIRFESWCDLQVELWRRLRVFYNGLHQT